MLPSPPGTNIVEPFSATKETYYRYKERYGQSLLPQTERSKVKQQRHAEDQLLDLLDPLLQDDTLPAILLEELKKYITERWKRAKLRDTEGK